MDSKEVHIRKPCMMHAGTNYQVLHEPLLEEEESLQDINSTFAIIAGDELTDLCDVKKSSDWPEWHKAMGEEIKLLTEMGTWEMVDKPPDAVPIPNKWVFLKKRNKEGIVTRYRARLVIKGCTQCPGYDFVKTFSPVIRMDSLCAILALVPIKKLKIHIFLDLPKGYEPCPLVTLLIYNFFTRLNSFYWSYGTSERPQKRWMIYQRMRNPHSP